MPLLMFVMFSLASILGTNPSQRDVPPVEEWNDKRRRRFKIPEEDSAAPPKEDE